MFKIRSRQIEYTLPVEQSRLTMLGFFYTLLSEGRYNLERAGSLIIDRHVVSNKPFCPLNLQYEAFSWLIGLIPFKTTIIALIANFKPFLTRSFLERRIGKNIPVVSRCGSIIRRST